MPKNIFKIYDGRTNFWQWDTGQKLIVLDDTVTEVHFSNRNMEHSKKKTVYKDKDGLRVVNIPDLLLQLPKNLIAYAYTRDENGTGKTVKSVKFAVIQRPIPVDYVCGQDDVLEDVTTRLELLEALMKDVATGKQQLTKFTDIVEAAMWALQEGEPGDIIAIKMDGQWLAHIVEDDKSISVICDANGKEAVITFDGDDADGIEGEVEYIRIFDGGGAAGI